MTPVTVVIGGSGGIGAATCRRLAGEGHDLVVGFHSNIGAASRVASDIQALGRRALIVQVDATDAPSVGSLIDRAAELGPLTGLVNSAGSVHAIGPLEQLDPEAVRRDVEVNLLAVLLACHYAVAPMAAAGGGAIVNISSAAATLGSPGEYVHYAASKAAVDTVSIGLAKELGPQRIRVNSVAPGIIETDFHADPDRPAKLAATIPLGRPGQVDEVAGAVAWLLSEAASYTTGAILRVAGGR